MKFSVVMISLFVGLMLSGCGNKVFIKKVHQTDKEYRSDMMYCKGEALGAWNDQNGTSNIQIRSQTMAPMTFEDCMRQMGYQQEQ